MAAANALAEDIRSIFREVLTIEVPADDTDLIDGGLLDSLTLIELLFQMEERFGVDLMLGQLEIENFRTVERMVEFVGRQKDLTAGPASTDS